MMTNLIEDAQQYVLGELRKAQKKSALNSSGLHWADYDVHLNTTVTKLMHIKQIPDINDVVNSLNRSYQDRQALELRINTLQRAVSDALWELCRRGILRPGTNHLGSQHASVNDIHEGFTVTAYGQNWLETYTQEDILPATPERFTQIFYSFQALFGKSFFRRAKEAVSCYQGGNYLACCVMCGTAIESILLSAAFIVSDREEIIKMYYGKNGRGRVEKLLFDNTKDHIKNYYKKYTDLIGYWRNESGHGEESDIDINEAYVGMLTLLRFSEFMRDHWDEITNVTN